MDKVDRERIKEDVDTIIEIRRQELCGDRAPFDRSADEYLHRLLSERYVAGWDDAMDLVGSKLAEPAPERTRYREDITR